jgi:hypothetical protein
VEAAALLWVARRWQTNHSRPKQMTVWLSFRFRASCPPEHHLTRAKDRLGLGPSAFYSLAPDPAYAVSRGP